MTIAQLIKAIRDENDMTQQDLATALGVSKVLIVMVETKRKAPSKKLIFILAKKLKVHPASIMPFLAFEKKIKKELKPSIIESTLIKLIDEFQVQLIKKRSKILL